MSDRRDNGECIDPWFEEDWKLVGAKVVVVDGDKIKADTWYFIRDGEIMELKDEEDNIECASCQDKGKYKCCAV